MELALDRWYLCAALRGAREAGVPSVEQRLEAAIGLARIVQEAGQAEEERGRRGGSHGSHSAATMPSR